MGRHLERIRMKVRKFVDLGLAMFRPDDCPREDVDYEALVQTALLEAGSLGLNSLIDRVAAEAMRIETIRGAWVSDVGLWGPELFRREAATAVRRMIGRSLALEFEGMPIAIPVFEGR